MLMKDSSLPLRRQQGGYPPQGYPPQQPSPQPGYGYPPQQVHEHPHISKQILANNANRGRQQPAMAMDPLLQEDHHMEADQVRVALHSLDDC
jgi:hypothetical protein